MQWAYAHLYSRPRALVADLALATGRRIVGALGDVSTFGNAIEHGGELSTGLLAGLHLYRGRCAALRAAMVRGGRRGAIFCAVDAVRLAL